MRRRRIVPFLGAGVNLAERRAGEPWEQGVNLPSGAELAEMLATRFPYPKGEPRDDLMRVAQYVESSVGETAIYDEFREVFAGAFEPTVVHRVLAKAPEILAEKGIENPYLLVVTTNYDDALERAFEEAGQAYDVVWYMARGDHHRRFIHQAPGSEPTSIDDPALSGLSVEERNMILKIHGAAYRPGEEHDSFVVTEDQYIDYMSTTDLASAVPVKLLETMLNAHFLFLGYRLADWNLRVFLHTLWARRDKTANSWSVDRAHRELDKVFWQRRSVEMVTAPLAEYVASLEGALRRL
jgi:SIR2-like domain